MHKFTYLILFIATFISRLLFKWQSGYDNFQIFGDSVRYDILSDRILAGNTDMDFIAFLISPLYPYTLALFKWLSAYHWETLAVLYQFLLVSLSVVYLTKLSFLLFNNKMISLLSGLIYMQYPMTLFYNFTLSQETTFQAYFIIAFFFLVKFLKKRELLTLVKFSILFSLAFLTKSHILLFTPWIVILIFYDSNPFLALKEKIIQTMVVGVICFIFTIPDGIKNYKLHGIYTFSGTGVKTFFHNGNSQENYDFVFHNTGLHDDQEMRFIFDTTYYYKGFGKVNEFPHKVKQDLHFTFAMKWIQENPVKFLKLKVYSAIRFFAPGVSYSKYKVKVWLMSMLMSAPVFIFAYIAFYRIIKNGDFYNHRFTFFLMVNVFLFYIVFMPQTRFRVITLEPFYIIYAAYALAPYIKWLSDNNKFAKSFIK